MLRGGKSLMYAVARGIMDSLLIISRAYLNLISYSINQIIIENNISGNSELKILINKTIQSYPLCMNK